MLRQVCNLLQTTPAGLVDRVERLLHEHRELGREIEKLKTKLTELPEQELLDRAKDVGGVSVLSPRLSLDSAGLRSPWR